MKKLNNKYDLIAQTLIISFLILIFLCSTLIPIHKLSLLNYSYVLIGIGAVSFIYMICYLVSKIDKLKYNHLYIVLLIIFGIISLIFAINKKNALFGLVTRYEGLLVIISYYMLYLVSNTIYSYKGKKRVLNTLLIIGLLHSVYGILQAYHIETFLGFDIVRRIEYVSGIVGNSNFYSALMLMFLGLSVGGYYSKQTSILYVFPFAFCVLLANSFTGIITICVMFLGLIIHTIYTLKKKKNSDYLLKTISMIMISVGCYFIILFSLPHYMEDYFKQTNEITEDIKNEGETVTTFGSRLYLWETTIKRFPKYFITGCGISNFQLAFERPIIDPISKRIFDKAHNEYLHKMFCEGIFSILVYLYLILEIFVKYVIKLFKNKTELDDINFPFFLAFCMYSFQAFANISVTRVSPIYFVIMGMITINYKNLFNKKRIIYE